jgi:hypothetical protein
MRFAPAIAACALLIVAPAVATGKSPLEPAIVGWEQFFKVSWEPGERGGKSVVRGTVEHTYGTPVTRVQLLVDSLDASGAILNQQVVWLPGDLVGFQTAYFEVPVRQPAPAYRVRVFGWERIEAGPIR